MEVRVELFWGLNELMWGVQSLEQCLRHGRCSVIVSCFYLKQGTVLRPKLVDLFLKRILLLSPGVPQKVLWGPHIPFQEKMVLRVSRVVGLTLPSRMWTLPASLEGPVWAAPWCLICGWSWKLSSHVQCPACWEEAGPYNSSHLGSILRQPKSLLFWKPQISVISSLKLQLELGQHPSLPSLCYPSPAMTALCLMRMRQLSDCVHQTEASWGHCVHFHLPHVPHFPCIWGNVLHKCLLSSSIPFTLYIPVEFCECGLYTESVPDKLEGSWE